MRALVLAAVAALGMVGDAGAVVVSPQTLDGGAIVIRKWDGSVYGTLRENGFSFFIDGRWFVETNAVVKVNWWWAEEGNGVVLFHNFGYHATGDRYSFSLDSLHSDFMDNPVFTEYDPYHLSKDWFPRYGTNYTGVKNILTGEEIITELGRIEYYPVPLPAAAPMLLTGAAALAGLRIRRRARAIPG